MDNKVKKYASRYLIPFFFDYEGDGYSLLVEHIINEEKNYKNFGLPKDCKWIEKGFWENYKNDKVTYPEMDIYSYLLELFGSENMNNDEANLGTSFVLRTNGTLLSLQYVPVPNGNEINFHCNNIGMLLFRNGIGFLWYDIEFCKLITVEDYVSFVHDFKELARTNSQKFRRITGKDSYEIFCMGKWAIQLLETSSLNIHFWAERKVKMEDNTEIVIPDKALLFQYLYVDSLDKQKRNDLAFRIGNGYDQKYKASALLESEIYEPFGNISFYVSKAGLAYVASNNDTNSDFFENNFIGKFVRDYFFIYVLNLYQTYSCSHYSRLLTKLPADVKTIDNNEIYVNRIESLDTQINLFLVKSTYETVSNIQHQNGAYIYSKQALRIEEDMESLTKGLRALRSIEDEKQKEIEQERIDKKDRAINNGLILFGFIAVVSAMIDALNLIDWVYSPNVKSVWHILILLFIAVPAIYMILIFVINTRRKN